MFADFFEANYAPASSSGDVRMKSPTDPSSGLGAMVIRPSEVYEALNNIDTKEGVEPDGVSPIFLRNCAASLTAPLHIVFNRSL